MTICEVCLEAYEEYELGTYGTDASYIMVCPKCKHEIELEQEELDYNENLLNEIEMIEE